jgi:DNA-binding transcriptional MerR regulator
LAGVTLRQLQWWRERGIVVPSARRGQWRPYAPEQVAEVLLLRALRAKGISLVKCRRLLAKCRRENAFARPGACLVFDPRLKLVRIETGAAAICEAVRAFAGGVFVVALGGV